MARFPRICRGALFGVGRAMLVAATAAPAVAFAQETTRVQPEVRLDAFAGPPQAAHAGVGISAPLGTYVRFGVLAGLGAGTHGSSGHTDLIARFTLDPFREKNWAPYGVGGVSVLYGGSATRSYLLLLAGVEGPAGRGFVPAAEFGFGGGFRAGLILRRAFPRRR